MSVIQAALFGLVQGLTEFLPVSSSGHLTLLRVLMGMQNDIPATMDILLHLGTLIAVVAVYWRRILNMILHPIKSELPMLVLATAPAVVFVLLCKFVFHFDVDEYFNYEYLGFFFLITTLLLWLADLLSGMAIETKEVKWYNALAMGIMQCMGLLSGISRSGSAISGGISTGLSRKRATDFAFLMSIPAILGALVFKLPDMFESNIAATVGVVPMLVALVVAAGAGYLGIKFILAIIRRVRITWFGLYTAILGVAVLLDQYVFHIFFKL